MPEHDPNVAERLRRATWTLACGRAHVQDRLRDAYISALSGLRPEDFADENDRREFEEIMEAMTSEPAAGEEGTLASTLVVTSNDAAVELAERIVALDDRYR